MTEPLAPAVLARLRTVVPRFAEARDPVQCLRCGADIALKPGAGRPRSWCDGCRPGVLKRQSRERGRRRYVRGGGDAA